MGRVASFLHRKIFSDLGKSVASVAPVVRLRSQSKRLFFVIFAWLTVFVIYMKNARIFDPASPIAHHFARSKW